MSKSKKLLVVLMCVSLGAAAVPSSAQTVAPKEQEGALISVLKSNASQKEAPSDVSLPISRFR